MGPQIPVKSVIELADAAISAGDKAIGLLNGALSGDDARMMDVAIGLAAALSALGDGPVLGVLGLTAAAADLAKNVVELEAIIRSGANARDIAAAVVGTAGALAGVAANGLPPPHSVIAAGLSIAASAAKAAIAASDPWVPPISEKKHPILDASGLDPNTLLPKRPVGVNVPFRTATASPRRDPLAIDLDGDGIETIGIPTDGTLPVLFDHDADGVKAGTGWLMPDDGWLVRDINGNGIIDSGRELFGADTQITKFWSSAVNEISTTFSYTENAQASRHCARLTPALATDRRSHTDRRAHTTA